MAISIAGSQNPCKFDNLILQVSYGTPLKQVLIRIHYNYDDSYEEKADKEEKKEEKPA